MSGQDSARAFLAVEALLEQLRPEAEAAELARTLRDHFDSADAMFRADPHVLEGLGLRPSEALLLGKLPELSRCMQRAPFEQRPALGRLCNAEGYLVALFHGLRVERFYLLCLDARGRLRECVLLQEGVLDGALFPLRRMLSEAIRIGADAAVIAHNHPGLTLRPSEEDLDCTREAIRALSAVGIPLLDHVIVAGRRAVSLRRNNFLPAQLWLNQSPDSRLLLGWLEGCAQER